MPHDDPRIQKLDDLSLSLLSENEKGPCDECICNLLNPPKPTVSLRNKLRNWNDSVQMCKDSTGKLLFGTTNPNLAIDETDGKKKKGAEPKKPKGKPPKGGKGKGGKH